MTLCLIAVFSVNHGLLRFARNDNLHSSLLGAKCRGNPGFYGVGCEVDRFARNDNHLSSLRGTKCRGNPGFYGVGCEVDCFALLAMTTISRHCEERSAVEIQGFTVLAVEWIASLRSQ